MILVISTYNNFKHYIFWEVLEGLSKIKLIKKAADHSEKIHKDINNS